MKKNAKILLASAAGIVVLGSATLVLVLTAPQPEVADSGDTSDSTAELFSYKADDVSKLTITNDNGEFAINRLGVEKWGIDNIPEENANSASYRKIRRIWKNTGLLTRPLSSRWILRTESMTALPVLSATKTRARPAGI